MWHSILLGVSTIYFHYTGECWNLSYLCTRLLSVSCCGLMQGKHTSISTENEEEQYTSKRLTCHHGSVLDQLLGKRFRRCNRLVDLAFVSVSKVHCRNDRQCEITSSEQNIQPQLHVAHCFCVATSQHCLPHWKSSTHCSVTWFPRSGLLSGRKLVGMFWLQVIVDKVVEIPIII